MANLNIKLDESEKQNGSLKDQISTLTEKLASKENHIRTIQNDLDSKNNEVKFLRISSFRH